MTCQNVGLLDTSPFYEARARLFADNKLYHLAYFHHEVDALAHAADYPGAYVLETSRGMIWRSTVPV